ncbi:MAG: guanylate kinase [Rhodospirillaceae bacterium]
MLVLSSPSGAGKTTISRKLLARDQNLTMSVSATTRPMRPGEKDGVDYYFLDPTEFNLMINRRELLEYAKVFDNYYGTPVAAVQDALEVGKDVIFDIDWQGSQQIAEKAREDLVSIFILPPSTAELDRRLHNRAQDPENVVAARMAKAPSEMSHYAEYDFIIVNYNVEESVAQVEAIIAAERLRRHRMIGLTDFVKRLQEGY